MIKNIKRTLAGLLIAPILAVSAAIVPIAVPAFAACSTTTPTLQSGADCAAPTGQVGTTLFGGSTSIFTKVVNILLFIIGAVAVIMLIFGGVRYTLSAGREKEVEAAKNTILYAIIGIVVAFLAYAVVNWVIGAISGP
jgi:hypothetical protein